MGKISHFKPGYRPANSDLVILHFAGFKQYGKEKANFYLMLCTRTRNDGTKCTETREIAVKDFGKKLACEICSTEKKQMGRSRGGRTVLGKEDSPGAIPNQIVTKSNYKEYLAQFEAEEANGHPEKIRLYRYYMRPGRPAHLLNIMEAIDLVLRASVCGKMGADSDADSDAEFQEAERPSYGVSNVYFKN